MLRFRRSIHWFHLDSVRDVLHLLTVENFIRLPNFFVNERLWRKQNNATFFVSKIRLRNLMQRTLLAQGFETQQSKYYGTSFAKQIILPPRQPRFKSPGNEVATQILRGHVISRSHREAVERGLGNDLVCKILILVPIALFATLRRRGLCARKRRET